MLLFLTAGCWNAEKDFIDIKLLRRLQNLVPAADNTHATQILPTFSRIIVNNADNIILRESASLALLNDHGSRFATTDEHGSYASPLPPLMRKIGRISRKSDKYQLKSQRKHGKASGKRTLGKHQYSQQQQR